VVAEPVLRRVALVVHPTRRIDQALATLTGWAADHGVDVIQLAVDGARLREVAAPGVIQAGDLVVAVGGDGTVLASLRAAAPQGVPVLGVACGSLGALTAVAADEISEALDSVRAGAWRARSLPALAIGPEDAPDDWAANDFVVVRRGAGQLVADLVVDDELYARVAGDGLVVATALGSSAYSMAAGGPVLTAGTAAFVCTPLAMHGGNAPPLVVPAEATITVDVEPGYAGFEVEIDGRRSTPRGQSFRLTLEPGRTSLVGFGPPGRALAGLRRRRLITDSPRILARDDRAPAPPPPAPPQ
jgi:NAD+ kinase